MKYKSEINISTPIYEKKFTVSAKDIDALVDMIEFRIQDLNDYLDHEQLTREEWREAENNLAILGNLSDWIKESGIKANTGKKQAE